MPLYPLRCPDCGTEKTHASMTYISKLSTGCDCGGTLKRVWTTPAVSQPFQAHWNYTVGQHVSSMREFKDALKAGAERQSEKTGLEHRYVPVESGDKQGLGVTDDTESTDKFLRDRGIEQPKRSYFS